MIPHPRLVLPARRGGELVRGHCFAWAHQTLGLGPLIGMPLPGTCTFGGGQWLPNEPGVVDEGRDRQLERAVEELLGRVGG